ncbi:MAG TPA: ATP-dependent helicase [Isosphaeraceae bacterium]|jgi:DNA helicase-2/ATP-dependent DNA helicase PcrA|nr:ATP-dependent helicase [Isosphaeraceae bacterium]
MRKIRLQKGAGDRLRERFAADLNDAQREAATAPDGCNLILAGPGSGKTRVIIYRVAYLIARGVPAESILLVTFTRRAAREMLGRLEALVGAGSARVWAGTFHHIGNRILRRAAGVLGFGPNFTILDGEDQRDLVRLAMEDAGLVGTGRLAPKPAAVQHLISLAFNARRLLADLVAERQPGLADWLPQLEETSTAYAARKKAANALDYDDLLGEWARLIAEFPDQLAAQGRQFRHVLVDEMQDTNLVQIDLVETIARAGAGNLTAVGDDAQSIYRFRGANYDNILKFPERNPGARVYRLEVNYRSTPEIVAFTNASIAHNTSGFPKTLVSAREGGPKPVVVAASDAYEEADFVCQEILDLRERGLDLGRIAVLYRNHHDSILLQGELVSRGITYTVRSGQRFFEQAHIKDVLAYLRVLVNPRDEPAWRRLLVLLPGVGPAKASAVYGRLAQSADPLAELESSGTMATLPTRSKGPFAGFVADLRAVRAARPESDPAAAIGAILKGGYPATVRALYERPDNRIADIEQLAALARRFDSLERFTADLMLAGDVYGMDSVESAEAGEVLVLSTIHQAKGLEWSRVFIPRLIDDGFPNRRALAEPGGEDEERRIFYVAVTRAMDELFLSYPLSVARGGLGPTTLTTRSRFLDEIDPELVEPAELETDLDLGPTGPVP